MELDLDSFFSLRESENFILADSEKVILKFLNFSNLKPISILLSDSFRSRTELYESFSSVHFVDNDIFKERPGLKFHKGIIAKFSKPIILDITELRESFFFLNGLTSPENVGSIIRTLAGLGIKNIVFDNKTCNPFLRRCIRVSMGNVVFLNIFKVQSFEDISFDKFEIYSTGNEQNSISINDWKPRRPFGVVIGSEGHGVDKEFASKCFGNIKIPIVEDVQHLNASNAASILAYKASELLNLI